MCSAVFFDVLLVCLVRAFCLTMYVVFGCFVRLLLFMFSSFVLCGVLFVCLVRGFGSVGFPGVCVPCFVRMLCLASAFVCCVQAPFPCALFGSFVCSFS